MTWSTSFRIASLNALSANATSDRLKYEADWLAILMCKNRLAAACAPSR
jgi:hypothetical protein